MFRLRALRLVVAAGLLLGAAATAAPGRAATADEALAEAQARVAANPRDPAALRALGDAFEVKGQPGEARVAYQKALQIAPAQGEARAGLARVLAQLGEDAAALAEQQKVADARPTDAAAHHLLGVMALRAGKPERAIGAWKDTLRIHPDHVGALNDMGAALLELARPAEAIPALEQAVRLAPELAVARTNLGYAYMRVGRPAEALKEYRAVVELDPQDPDANRNLAVAYMEAGRPRDAIPLFREVVRLEPSPEAIRDLGVALFEVRRLDEAELVLKTAVAARPDWGAAHVDLGRVQAARGEPDAALASLQKGLELDPKDAEGHLALARLGAQRKDYALARWHAREAERLGHPRAGALLAELPRDVQEGGQEDRPPPAAKKGEPGRPAKKGPGIREGSGR